jgi:hypothetical protein
LQQDPSPEVEDEYYDQEKSYYFASNANNELEVSDHLTKDTSLVRILQKDLVLNTIEPLIKKSNFKEETYYSLELNLFDLIKIDEDDEDDDQVT